MCVSDTDYENGTDRGCDTGDVIMVGAGKIIVIVFAVFFIAAISVAWIFNYPHKKRKRK